MVSQLVRAQLTYHNTNFKNTLYATPLSNNLFNSLVLKAQLLQSLPTSSQQIIQAKAGCLVLIFTALKSCNLVAITAVGFLASKASHYNGLEFHNAFFLVLTKKLVTQLVVNTVAYQILEIAILIMLYLLKGTYGIGPLVQFGRGRRKTGAI